MTEETKWRKTIEKKIAKVLKKQEEKEFTEFTISLDDNKFDAVIAKLHPTTGLHKGRTYYLKIYTKYDIKGNMKYFPFSPPKVIFLTKIWHSNVYGNGDICLDILKDQWSVMYNIDTVVLSILNLLEYPNPDSAANGAAGKQEREFLALFDSSVRGRSYSESEKDDIKRDIYAEYLNEISRFEDYNLKISNDYEVLFK